MSIVDKLVKRFNSEDVVKFTDKDNFKDNKSWVPTGSPELDYNLGILGFPTGMIEIAGLSRSGKTTLALQGMKHFLKKQPNGIAVILSSENRDNKDYAIKIGIDPDKVLIIKIRYVEEMFMKVKKLIEDSKKIFIEEEIGETPKFYFMWDSLGATLSKAELDTLDDNTKTMEKALEKGKDMSELKHAQMASFAKSAKMFAKYLTGEMYDSIVHFVILNHVHDQIGGMSKEKKSGGGEWIQFFPTIRLRTTLIGHEKIDDVEVAQYTEIKTVKNDFGSRRKTKITILLGYGIILSDEDINYAVEKGIVKKKSATVFDFMGKMQWKSKRTFFDLYYERNKFLDILTKKITEARHDDVMEERYPKL